jgi:hypothetical protein
MLFPYHDLPAAPRIVVIGDIHGDLYRLTLSLVKAKIIDANFRWIARPANTVVIQMGDQVDSMIRDRNAQSDWERRPDIDVVLFMHHVDSIARQHGGRVISLIGNHEMMNLTGDFSYVSDASLREVGGVNVRARQFRPGGAVWNVLKDRPVVVKIGKQLFCHAGVLPHHVTLARGELMYINRLFHRWMELGSDTSGLPPHMRAEFNQLFQDSDSLLWTRKYSDGENQDPRMLEYVLSATQCRAMYVGHTVMPRIMALYDRRLWFVDVGLSRSFGANGGGGGGGGGPQILEVLDDGVPLPRNDHQPFRVISLEK